MTGARDAAWLSTSGVAGFGLAILAATSGCSVNPPLELRSVLGGEYAIELSEVPHYPQEAHHCGPASLLTVLEDSGISTDYDTVVDRVYIPGLEGSLQTEMLAAARAFGRVAYRLPPDPAAVFAELRAGRPVVTLSNLGLPRRPIWHYDVVVGLDTATNRVLVRGNETRIDEQWARAWLRRWDYAARWAMVLLPPGEWPADPRRDLLLDALAAFEETGDSESVERAWRTATERWPQEPVAWLGLGNAAARRGDWETARRSFAHSVELDPSRFAARLNLGRTLLLLDRACDGLEVTHAPPIGHPLYEDHRRLEAELRARCDTF